MVAPAAEREHSQCFVMLSGFSVQVRNTFIDVAILPSSHDNDIAFPTKRELSKSCPVVLECFQLEDLAAEEGDSPVCKHDSTLSPPANPEACQQAAFAGMLHEPVPELAPEPVSPSPREPAQERPLAAVPPEASLPRAAAKHAQLLPPPPKHRARWSSTDDSPSDLTGWGAAWPQLLRASVRTADDVPFAITASKTAPFAAAGEADTEALDVSHPAPAAGRSAHGGRNWGGRGRVVDRRWCHIYLDQAMVTIGFEVAKIAIGRGGCNTAEIFRATDAKIRVRGLGSGHVEKCGSEAPVHLMITITTERGNDAGFVKAFEMTLNLAGMIEERFAAFCRARGRQMPPGPRFWVGDGLESSIACLRPVLGTVPVAPLCSSLFAPAPRAGNRRARATRPKAHSRHQ